MRFAVSLTLGLGLTLGAPAWAGSCFCLVDQDRTPYYDCVEGYRGAARTPYVECRLDLGPTRVEIQGGPGMKQVPAGEPPCVPCEVRARPLGPDIRTGDDAAATTQGTGHD